jgi:membrane fusion protein (multidrug efflux system)
MSSNIPPETRRSVITRPRILMTASVLLAALIGTVYLISIRGEVTTDDAQIDGRLVPVAPKISGYVSELLVDDNRTVTKGQVVARIDPHDLQTAVEQAAAAVRSAEAQAAASFNDVPLTSRTTNSSILAAEASLAAAQAELTQARKMAEKAHGADMSFAAANVADRKANYERAHSDFARMQALVDKREISRLQFDGYVATERMAKSQLDAAEQTLAAQYDAAQIADSAVDRALSRVQVAKAQLAEANANHQRVDIRTHDAAAMRAAVDVAQANLDRAKLQLSYTEILAPQTGKVTRRTVETGAYVSPGQTLLTIVPTRDIWVTANFKETQLRNMKPGDRAEITIDQLGRRFRGHVDSIANATGSRLSLLPPENATGNYVKIVQRIPVKILLDPDALASGTLGVGANVDATVHTH